jgi:hypothetical protein
MLSKEIANDKIHWPILASLALIKLVIHFSTNANYGLHRDEYLYLNQGEHLSWGYMEVPPMIALIGKISRVLLGDTVFAARFFPALVGAASIILIGVMVRDMGGKKWAQFLAGFGFLASPAFLGSNTLFQPVSFNQFFWLVAALLVVKIICYQQPRHWYLLGVTVGLGFLNKYSIAFFALALMIGFLISPHRKVFRSRYPWVSMGIALVIALPNLIWQYRHDFPVVRHMRQLASDQLAHVQALDFLAPQLIFHFACSLIWIGGLIYLITSKKIRSYRLLAWSYLFLIGMLLLLSGKDYYSIGAYSMLFAAGGIAWEKWLGRKVLFLVPIILILNLPIYPFAIPIIPIAKMKEYSTYLRDEFGFSGPLRWEDGSIRDLPQDYADMQGWEEIPAKVAKLYHSLSTEEQEKCMIIAGHYGQAGVMNFHRKKYNLPETYSFNSSFIMWLPDSLDFDRQIQIDDNPQSSSRYFESVELIDSIANPNARDPGLIYYKTGPKMDVNQAWRELVRERKREAGYD